MINSTKNPNQTQSTIVTKNLDQHKKNSNSVAHNLAKHAICILDFLVWTEDVPSHIVLFLQLDVVDLP